MLIKNLYTKGKRIYKEQLKKIRRTRKLNSIYKWERYADYYQDQCSIDLIKARVQFLRDKKNAIFSDRIIDIEGGVYHLDTAEVYLHSRVAIVGDEAMCQYTINTIRNSDYSGETIHVGKDIKKLKGLEGEYSILIAERNEESIKLKEAIKTDYPNMTVIEPEHSMLIGILGNQYFDVFAPNEHEIIVDGGAFDGKTEVDFFNWGSGKIDKIYAFEMDPYNAKNCLEYYKANDIIDKVVMVSKGTGKRKQTVYLREESVGSAGSKMGEGTLKAEITRIDDEVGNDAVTFIKLDVEGAELDTLKGAKRTIKNNKPRLAISIYHKPEDLYEIPGYLHKLVPEYRFIVRQYTSMIWEAVLYAYIP